MISKRSLTLYSISIIVASRAGFIQADWNSKAMRCERLETQQRFIISVFNLFVTILLILIICSQLKSSVSAPENMFGISILSMLFTSFACQFHIFILGEELLAFFNAAFEKGRCSDDKREDGIEQIMTLILIAALMNALVAIPFFTVLIRNEFSFLAIFKTNCGGFLTSLAFGVVLGYPMILFSVFISVYAGGALIYVNSFRLGLYTTGWTSEEWSELDLRTRHQNYRHYQILNTYGMELFRNFIAVMFISLNVVVQTTLYGVISLVRTLNKFYLFMYMCEGLSILFAAKRCLEFSTGMTLQSEKYIGAMTYFKIKHSKPNQLSPISLYMQEKLGQIQIHKLNEIELIYLENKMFVKSCQPLNIYAGHRFKVTRQVVPINFHFCLQNVATLILAFPSNVPPMVGVSQGITF